MSPFHYNRYRHLRADFGGPRSMGSRLDNNQLHDLVAQLLDDATASDETDRQQATVEQPPPADA